AAGGGRVASVHEGVDVDAPDAGVLRDPDQGVEMFLVGMDAAVGEEAPEMERAVADLEVGEEAGQGGIGGEAAVGDGLVDSREFLVDDAARAEIEMAD